MIVMYKGPSDFQEFSAADLKKAGIEDGKKVRFANGEPTEVDDAVGQKLVSTDPEDNILHDYNFVEVDEDGEEVKQSKSSSGDGDGDPDLGDADSRGDQNDTDPAGAGGGTGDTGGGTTARKSTAKKAAAGNRSSTRSS